MTEDWFDRLMGGGGDLLLTLMENACHQAGAESEYESPIEHVMASAMCAVLRVNYPSLSFKSDRRGMDHKAAKKLTQNLFDAPTENTPIGCILPQVTIDDYRADFFITYTHGLSAIAGIVVECDGHEFHEKTKKQAARDKARDRAMQGHGYRVFRFTGSEIWRNPIICAQEVLSFAHDTAQESQFARHMAETGDMEVVRESLKWIS